MLIKRNILAVFAMSFMASATASEFSLGAGAVYNESPYRGYNENVHAAPLISYESESFYFRQTSLGYILSKNEKNEFSITASWMPLEFDPADNDEHDMKQLDKRDSTAMVGAAWYRHEKWGSVKVSAAADVLDNSNGWVGEVSVFRPMPVGKFTLTPSAGVLYYDKNFNDYYYGVSDSESRRSGLSSYSPDDSWMPYVGLAMKYPLTNNLVLVASATYTVLPDDVKDSPMVDRDDSFTFLSGVSWRF
ncbi:MipA/OmpV family protein [Citrobacter enshiensis]|uniref:MipA/OmpV family protein n=1 Tax=Citrobacter enshiensis TaxID=2971264 RepID=A0ABT8PZR1_9ENTR|nr:MipA/OmpV family protein [Citrobacter enshiensis]MDN8600859.1 MipA/OmpV family protein [Citrobacter enshiensis]WET40795.1 MipA/OmpV family protein [Citrobacter enshiensis]